MQELKFTEGRWGQRRPGKVKFNIDTMLNSTFPGLDVTAVGHPRSHHSISCILLLAAAAYTKAVRPWLAAFFTASSFYNFLVLQQWLFSSTSRSLQQAWRFSLLVHSAISFDPRALLYGRRLDWISSPYYISCLSYSLSAMWRLKRSSSLLR